MTLAIPKTVELRSEVGRLTHVCLHPPGYELLVPPRRAVEWLFEDIVDLGKTREQHDQIAQILKQCGVTTYDTQSLLAATFRLVPSTREWLVHRISALENISPDTEREILDLDHEALATTCVTGLLITDPEDVVSGVPRNLRLVFRPLPNLMFTRDMSAAVGDHVILSQAAKSIRVREAMIYRTIFHFHPDFVDIPRLEPWGPPDQPVTVEGGDILVLSKEHVAIGVSERTNDSAVCWLKAELFRNKIVEGVFVVRLPEERRTMHLDTIFTFVADQECLAYAPLISQDADEPARVSYYARRSPDTAHEYNSLERALDNRGYDLNFIWCANRLPIHEDREQWVDAVNSLAVAPGVIIVYQRNPFTLEALRNEGYKIVTCTRFLSGYPPTVNPTELQKTAITIEGSELCRARGGPHCLTMPLRRDAV